MEDVWLDTTNFTHGRLSPIQRIIIHATRGGLDDLYEELEATLNWFQNPASEASAHAVIAYTGVTFRLVKDGDTAWHAGEENADSLGVELVQPFIDCPFSDAQYKALTALCLRWVNLYSITPDRNHILGHEETEQGKRLGKTDPGYKFDWARLMGGMMPEQQTPAQAAARWLKMGPIESLAWYLKGYNLDPSTANILLYAQWAQAGGDGTLTAFTEHLRKLGVIQSAQECGYSPEAELVVLFRK